MKRKSEKVNTEELRTALSDVGMLMRLPTKNPTAEMPTKTAAPPPPSEGGPRRSMGMLPVMAALVLVATGTVYLWPKAPIVVPENLQREWYSQNANFAGRRVKFTDDSLYMTLLPGTPAQPYAITAVSQIQKGDSTLLVVSYNDNGGTLELQAALHMFPAPRLVFARPEGLVWEPVTASTPASVATGPASGR